MIAFGIIEDRELAVVYTIRGARHRIISAGERIDVSAKHLVRRTPNGRRRGKTNWAHVDALSDQAIEHAVRTDPDAAPILDKRWFATATLKLPERKVPISLRVDREVVEWFKSQGRRYQSRMNAVLKAYVDAHRKTV